MTDPLTAGLHALTEAESPVSWPDVEARAATGPAPAGASSAPPDATRPRRDAVARRVLAAAAAVVLVVGGAVVLWPDDGDRVHTQPGPTVTTVDSAPTSVEQSTPEEPATGDPATTRRSSPVMVDTGAAILVWGGEQGNDQPRDDGFAIEAATGEVTPIPAAPIGPSARPSGVWTGSELVVWGTSTECGDCPGEGGAAAWDPAAGTWRELARPPEGIDVAFQPAGATWTGSEVVAIGEHGVAASYDPVADRWSSVPRLPHGLTHYLDAWTVVWTGAEVVAWRSVYDGRETPESGGEPIADRGWRWAPGASDWTPLPDLPPGSRTTVSKAAWTGEELVVWGLASGAEDVGVGATWRPGDSTWRPMAPSPQGPVDWYEGTPGSQAVVADAVTGLVIVDPLDGDPDGTPLLTYDPGRDTWAQEDIVADDWSATLVVRDGRVYVPDPSAPVAGDVEG